MFLSQISALTCWYFIICRVVKWNAMPVLILFPPILFSPMHILESNEAASEPNTFPNSRRQLWVHNVVAIQFRIWKASDIKFRENAHVSTRKRLQNKNIIPKDLQWGLRQSRPRNTAIFRAQCVSAILSPRFQQKKIFIFWALGSIITERHSSTPNFPLSTNKIATMEEVVIIQKHQNKKKKKKKKTSSPKIHWYLPPRPATNERYESKDCHRPMAKHPPSGHRRPKWAVVNQWNMIPPKKTSKTPVRPECVSPPMYCP